MFKALRSMTGWGLSWLLAFAVILLVVAFPRTVHYTATPGHLWASAFDWRTYESNIASALKAPFEYFQPGNADNRQTIAEHLPLSIFYIAFAFVGAYALGIVKGTLDVFWRDKKIYRTVQGLMWVVDALPMFAVVVMLELGTLYGAMYIEGDPISMIPDATFLGGWIIPATIFMWVPMMYIARVFALSVTQELSEQYVLTARSKGLWRNRVFWRHIFFNCVPKLLNESTTVFTMLMSSLLALEYLSFRWGGAFDLFVAMGHGQLGARSLYVSPGKFELTLVVDYLTLFALLTILFRALSTLLKKRWQVTHHA